MPPWEAGNCDPEIGGRNERAEVQVLKRDNGTVTTCPRMDSHRVAEKGNGCPTTAGEIPWRTSRRLQEATLRLIKERDGGQPHSDVSIKEEDDSRSTESLPAARSPKRQKQEHPAEVPVQDGESPTVAKAEQTSSASETMPSSSGSRRKAKRRRKAQFDEILPLFRQDEKKAIAGISSDEDQSVVPNHVSTPGAACKTAVGREKVESTVAANGIPPSTVKQPQSCFDLLCSHLGLRGWRCYRSRIASQAFCIYHLRQGTPVSGICLYT